MEKIRSSKKTSDKILSKVAILYYNEGIKQDIIAQRLNVSRTQISRYLKEARRRKIVKIEIVVSNEKYDNLENLVEKIYGINECVIFSSGNNIRENYKYLSNKFSGLIERIVSNTEFIAIGWGNTIYNMLLSSEFTETHKTNVLPLIGGLGITEEVNSNTIAKIFADQLGGNNLIIHTPAMFDTKEVRDLVRKESSIKILLDYYKKISVAVVGIAELKKNTTFSKAIDLKDEKIKMLSSVGIVGEINGLFIDENGVFVPNEINDRMLAILPDELRRINNVIGISFGDSKIKVIKAALKSKVINTLITDEETARKIVKMG